MPERTRCDSCHALIPPHAHYIVKIEVFADPELPDLSSDELGATDYQAAMSELLGQMQNMSEDELQNLVHRQFQYRLCPACHLQFLANPLGKPRVKTNGRN